MSTRDWIANVDVPCCPDLVKRLCFMCRRDIRIRCQTLGENLAAAGALCAAFDDGYGQGVDDVCEGEGIRRYKTLHSWSPGCGFEARGVGASKDGGE